MAGLVSVLLTAAALPLNAAGTNPAKPNSNIETDANVQAPVLAPLATHPRTAQIVVQQLRRNHYVDLKVNDALSSDMFDNYLEALDPGRYYFLAADIAEFEGYRYELDNALRRGDLLPAYRMFNRLQQRLLERTKYMQRAIDSGPGALGLHHR
jgi:carboxyl-terminal processing protease